LFGLDVDFRQLRERIQAADLQYRGLTADFLDDQDWQNCWRRYAVRCQFANRLWLAPREAEPVGDAFAPINGPGELVLRLDPGLAFGTGGHPTTRLCLDWLAHASLEDQRLLDFGCGSGVLALAARLLGSRPVYAVDHDPQALLATTENAAYNRLADDRLFVGTLDILADVQPFDVIVANILANPLIELAGDISALLAAGGKLVLSGILLAQIAEVKAAYPNMDFQAPAVEADAQGAQWTRLVATKRSVA
jgi:ribosomal protein L11 methyltransferase